MSTAHTSQIVKRDLLEIVKQQLVPQLEQLARELPETLTEFGMRNWTYKGIEGVLRIRAALQDGCYHQLWQNRLRPAA